MQSSARGRRTIPEAENERHGIRIVDADIQPAMEGQVYTLDAASGKLLVKHRPSSQSQIDGAEWDGERLFVQTRKNFDNAGEEAVYALPR